MSNTKKVSKPQVKTEDQDRFTWQEGDIKITPPDAKKPKKGRSPKKLTSK